MPAAIEDPIFQPARRIISAITQANPAVVTTSFAHDYFTGDILRLIVPNEFRMVGADKMKAPITVLSTTTISIPFNTIDFDSFTVAGALLVGELPASLVPMRIITAITRANPAAVTTRDAHALATNDVVRLQVPSQYAMIEANTLSAAVTVTGDNDFTIDINSTAFTAFINFTAFLQVAQTIPVGEINSTLFGATENTLPTRVR